MLLLLGILVGLGVLTIVLALRPWRPLRSVRLAAMFIGGLGVLLTAIAFWGASRQVPTYVPIEPHEVPGVYVFRGHDSRDEITMNPDGTFRRMAVYRGVAQMQQGRWRLEPRARSAPFDWVTFGDVSPPCLHKSAQEEAAAIHWSTPDGALCGPGTRGASHGVYFCEDDGRHALCFDWDTGFDFRKE